MAKLDDPLLRDQLVESMESGADRDTAARTVGLSRQSVSSYCRKHPELAERLAVAARRAQTIEHHAPRMLDGTGIGALTPAGRQAFLDLLAIHAADGGSRGCPKAIGILAELHFAHEMLAIQASAKRSAEQAPGQAAPLVVLELGQGRTPAPAIVDAQVVTHD